MEEAIKSGDRVQHKNGSTGKAMTDEKNGQIQVKNDKGPIETWERSMGKSQSSRMTNNDEE